MSEEPKEIVERVEVKVDIPEKVKKPRTEKQIAAQQKAFAILKEKREAKEKANKEEKEAREIAKEKWKEVKKKAPAEELVTKQDLAKFMNDVKGLLGSTAAPKAKEPVAEPRGKIAEKQTTTVVRREPVVEAPKPAVKLSGHELLDRLFFNQ